MRFEVQTKTGQRADRLSSIVSPQSYPSFILNFNHNWNDYGYSNWFALFYAETEDNISYVGEIKLMCREGDVMDYIPKEFEYLDERFCSIAISQSYYKNLHDHFDKNIAIEVLKALRDCAINVEIYEEFQHQREFEVSLIRTLESERAVREGRYIFEGLDVEDAYSFEYVFHPIYNPQSAATWKIDFEYGSPLYRRCAAVVGENGVGKTRLLTSFIKDLLGEAPTFTKRPLFSSVIAISSTHLDDYLRIENRNWKLPYSALVVEHDKTSAIDNAIVSVENIIKRGTVKGASLLKIYSTFINSLIKEDLDEMIVVYPTEDEELQGRRPYVNRNGIVAVVKTMSSGQMHLFSLINKIFENIHFDALLAFDEPEVHLHPKMISEFFMLLSKLLRFFESYAIIATHSPLVVREIMGKNVFLMQKTEDDIPLLGHLDIETFGEDISLLYRKIFSYDGNNSFFQSTVKGQIRKRKTYEQIVSTFSQDMPLSMNSRFMIRDMILEYNSNHAED